LAENADIKLLMFDGSQTEADAGTLALVDDHSCIVVNKCDDKKMQTPLGGGFEVSVKSGDGIDVLISALTRRIEDMVGLQETPALTRERHRAALSDAQDSLARALRADMPELCAEDLRLAIRSLGRITGRVDVEDLLDVVFRDFCIGK